MDQERLEKLKGNLTRISTAWLRFRTKWGAPHAPVG